MGTGVLASGTLRTMMHIELGFAFLFGAILGSFLNACIYRLPRDISIVRRSRSFCPRCEALIAWYDNIPLVSYLLLGGRCRSCSKPIPLRYLAVEFVTAVGFTLVVYHCRVLNGPYGRAAALGLPVWGWGHVLAHGYLLAALVLIAFVDAGHRIIPNEVTMPGILLGPVLSLIFPSLQPFRAQWIACANLDALAASAMGVILGGGLIWLLGLFGRAVFGKDAMGMGDVKMMAMVGGLLGWESAVLATPVAACVGSVIGIVIVLRTKDHYLPFGPFLAVGTLVTMFYGAFGVAYFQRAFTPCPVGYAYLMPLIESARF